MPDLPQDQMTRIHAVERNTDWPDSMEIVASWCDGTKLKVIEITREQFFGLGSHGAPLTGQALISMIDKLRQP